MQESTFAETDEKFETCRAWGSAYMPFIIEAFVAAQPFNSASKILVFIGETRIVEI